MSSSSSLSWSSCSFSSHGTDEEIIRLVQNMQEVVARHLLAPKKKKPKSKKKKRRKTYVHPQGIHQSVGRVSKSMKVASSSLESGYSSTASSATVHRSIKPMPETVAKQLEKGDTKTSEDSPSLDQKNNDKKVTCNRNLEESD